MFVTLDRRLRSLRAAHRDERGASLIVVIGLMAVGFIVASTIAAACMFAITQTTQHRQNLQAFAAAEAGRDELVARLSQTDFDCDAGHTYVPADAADYRVVDDGDPAYRAKVFTTTLATVGPADMTPADPDSAEFTAKWSTACPTSATTFVRLIVEGDGPDGGAERIDSVYTWASYQSVVEGGALGFMDSSYTTYGVQYSGDIVVRNGDFTCATGTTVDGSVYVLNGTFRVETPDPLFGILKLGSNCTVKGDIVASVAVDVPKRIGSSTLTVSGSIATSGSIVANQPIDAKGDVEAKGTITVGGDGRLRTGATDVLKPFRQTLGEGQDEDDYSYAKGDILAEGAISASGELSTSSGAVATNATLTASSALVSARTGLGARTGITATGSATVQATAGSIASGTTISTASGSKISGGGVTATQAITGSGTVTATLGDVRAGGGIQAGTVSATGGSIQAMGNLTLSANATSNVGLSVLATGAISVTGTLSAGGDIRAAGSITGGTTRSTGGSVTAVGAISGAVEADVDVRSGATVTVGASTVSAAKGSVLAVGDITISTGLARSAQQDIKTNGSILVTGSGGRVEAPTLNRVVHAGGAIDLTVKPTQNGTAATGRITAHHVTAGGAFKSRAACDINGTVHTGGAVTFEQALGNDNSAARCDIDGSVRAVAGGSRLPVPGSGNSNRVQVWVDGTVRSAASGSAWNSDGRYRNSAGSTVSPGTRDTSIAVPGSPGVVAPPAPTGLAAPIAPEAYAFTQPDYPNLHVRTGWIDLGTHITDWGSGFPDRYELGAGECTNAMNLIRQRIEQDGPGIVIDAATNCRATTIDLKGWASLNLRRDAIILVHNVDIRLIRFSQTGNVVRQLFIVQVDDNLRTARPSYDPTAPPEPQPDCEGRGKIDTFGAQWNQNWDPNVRVMLYSPCGTEWLGGGTGLFSSWSGRQYVANNGAHKDIIAKIDCQPMMIPGKLDLPCHVDTIGQEGGQQIVTGKRMGTRIYQTEP